MPTIPETYAGPLLRWALCVEDYPGASHSFDLVSGDVLGIPPEFGGRGKFLRCVIEFGSGSGRKPALGWKSLAGEKTNPDAWNTLSTKALGRALKRAGYPDDMNELRACVLWRRRRAEIAAIGAGTNAGALGTGETVEDALDAASVADPDHLGADDAPEPNRQAPIAAVAREVERISSRGYGGDYDGDEEDEEDPVAVVIDEEGRTLDIDTGEIIDAESSEETDDRPPSEETLSNLREAVTVSAKAKTQPALSAWAKDQGWTLTNPPTERAALALVEKAADLLEAPM